MVKLLLGQVYLRGAFMKKNKKLLYILKIIMFIILFLSALYFENAHQQRMIALIIIFVLFKSRELIRLSKQHFAWRRIVPTQYELFYRTYKKKYRRIFMHLSRLKSACESSLQFSISNINMVSLQCFHWASSS